MSDQLDSGFSLKDDIASIRTDPAFHDVTIVCSDGVEIGACRAILASRSSFFKAMFHGYMQEATSNKVTLHDIKSDAMHAVLRFIHSEDVSSKAISVAIDVYRAANFLLLPKLMKLVMERAYGVDNFEVAASLLNEAAVSLPWSENTKDLYEVLFKPFCTHSLAIGDLNGLSEDALELLLMKFIEMAEFKTPEYDLLLCIVEWAWKRNATAQSADERRTIFDAINLMPEKPSAKILLRNGPSHAPLLKMMQHVDLSLICTHRLKSLTEAVDVLTETSPQYLAFCNNTKCSAGHPSEVRRTLTTRFQWDQSKFANFLVYSEEGAVVEFPVPKTKVNMVKSVRTLTPCVAGFDGLCEWDIVVESVGFYCCDCIVDFGLVSESYTNFTMWVSSEWGLHSYKNTVTYVRGSVEKVFGRIIQEGDVITFHLELDNGTCALSVNGHNYGTVWTNLPRGVKLYPAVSLIKGAKFRIKPHIRL